MPHLRIGCLALITTLLGAGGALAAGPHADMVQGEFKTGPAVTQVCLGCHEQQAQEFMRTVHWTWMEPQASASRGEQKIGKANLINNFCIALPANWPRCTSCHAGYGWKDASFDFGNPVNVDCLVCHDTTGSYRKSPAGAGAPEPTVDLLRVAQGVGKPSRQACGSCHFFGGGGDHVKHGDLDSSLARPTRQMDVHMAVDDPNMLCQDCHKTREHRIPGEALSVSLGKGMRVACQDCHGRTPHRIPSYNRHIARVACETCHVPTFARTLPTKVWWDWSKAGQEREAARDRHGLETYVKIKGEFRWAKDVRPVYRWYNGEADRYLLGETIRPGRPVSLNRPLGERKDPRAKIHPFKVMRGKQPYDTVHQTLAAPHLFGGYWKHFDWSRAIADGNAAAGIPFSGSYGWVETEMFWKVNHMVVPKRQALRCTACHGATGRLDWAALGYAGDPAASR